MNANQETEKTLAHQASEWVTILRKKPTREELTGFAEWIKTSPRHVRDFLIMSTIEKELHQVDAERRFGAHELSNGASTNVITLNSSATPTPLRSWPWRWTIAAAVGFIALSLTFLFWHGSSLGGWHNYTTQIGEQRAFELADGSIVHLNTQSRINVHMSVDARDIELVAGEALFKVQPDPARPFRVHSQDTLIRAVGTQFNVYRQPHGTTVSVIEGKVAVTPKLLPTAAAELAAGEEARIDPDGKVLRQKSSDPSKAVAWRQRRLMFDQESLADMVGEFNRYNKEPQFHLQGAELRTRHYTGVFDADDPESLVQLLSAEPDLAVERKGAQIIVRMR